MDEGVSAGASWSPWPWSDAPTGRARAVDAAAAWLSSERTMVDATTRAITRARRSHFVFLHAPCCVNVNTTDATAGATALLLPARVHNEHTQRARPPDPSLARGPNSEFAVARASTVSLWTRRRRLAHVHPQGASGCQIEAHHNIVRVDGGTAPAAGARPSGADDSA